MTLFNFVFLFCCLYHRLNATSPSGKFLADNIVGSVVVFSLVFWIPLSILVHCVVRNCWKSIDTSSQRLHCAMNCPFLDSVAPWLKVDTVITRWQSCPFCFFLQDKRLDQQYEENTKSFYYPPSVSYSSLKCPYMIHCTSLAATLTKLIHLSFFKHTDIF